MDALVMLGPVLVGALLATSVGVVVLHRDRGRPPTVASVAAHAARTTQVALAGGAVVVLSVGAAAGLSSLPLGGLLLAAVPALVGLVHLALRLGGEVTWPGRATPVGAGLWRAGSWRTGSWRPVPRALLAWFVVLLLVLVVLALVADGPRTVAATFLPHEPDLPRGRYSVGPFPGWGYGLPIGALAAVLVGCAAWTVGVIARRPAAPGASPDQDADLRRRARSWVTQVTQLLLAATTAGVLGIAGRTLLATSTSTGRTAAGTICFALGVLAAVVGLLVATRAVVRRAASSSDEEGSALAEQS